MKQFKLAPLFVGLTLLSSAAFAHVSLKGEAMPMAPYNWTGFYAGLNAGVVNHTMNVTDVDATTFLATIQQVSNPKFSGGLQIGYRSQIDLVSVPGV
jgi:outer membrane immunogenic protein